MFDGDAAFHDVCDKRGVGGEVGGVSDEIVLGDVVVRGPRGGIRDEGETRWCEWWWCVVDTGGGWGGGGTRWEGREGFDTVRGRLRGGDRVFDHSGDDWLFFFGRLAGAGVGRLI